MIFEINPRFSSTVLMRNYLGFTDLLWSIEEKFGLKTKKNKIKVSKIISRYDEINFLN
jgi:carbamoyl-phosphate synthase large subunit